MQEYLALVGSESKPLRIGDLAKRAGKSARAVRLYEEKGLLGPALRTEGGHRLYSSDALMRLGWIDKLQVLGLSLGEIRQFLDDLDRSETAPDVMAKVREMFQEKLSQVRSQLRSLQELESELRDGLAYLESCSGCEASTEVTACRTCGRPHQVEPPPLITGLYKGGEKES